MVRILKVKELGERKRLLLVQSEMYRHTLRLEAANIKFSVLLLKQKYAAGGGLLSVGRLAPLVSGFLLARKFFRKKKPEPEPERTGGGFFASLTAGLQLFERLQPLLKGFFGGSTASRSAETVAEDP